MGKNILLKNKINKGLKEDKLQGKINPKALKQEAPFKNLFPIEEVTLSNIKIAISKEGFDESQGVIVWEKEGEKILIDGHTRLKAALETSLDSIPYISKQFTSEAEAIEYAYHIQFNRRNLKDKDYIKYLEDNRIIINNTSTERKRLSEFMGIGVEKIQRILSIIDKGTKEDIEAVKAGKNSVNALYNKKIRIKDKGIVSKRAKKANEIYNFVDQKIEKYIYEKDYVNTIINELLRKRNIQGYKEEYYQGYKDGIKDLLTKKL